MATAFPNDRPRIMSNNTNDQPNKYQRQESRRTESDQNKSTDEKNRLLQCSFCQESQPSTKHLMDHLMLCGNRTDQCPNCQKYVRRAIYAYHYENNCANFDEPAAAVAAPTAPLKHSSAQRSSSAARKSITPEENHPGNDHQTNHRDFTTVHYRPDRRDRPPSVTSNRSSLDIKECDFCSERCTRSDYENHQKSCLRNSVNINRKQQRKSLTVDSTESRSSISEDRRSKETARIPCEFCNEQIDFTSWTDHTKICLEKENRRIADRAEEISRQPIIEKLLCEHCHEQLPFQRLQIHETVCEKNPENRARATRLADIQSPRHVGHYNGLTNTRSRGPQFLSPYSSLPLSTTSNHSSASETRDILNRTDDLKNGAGSSDERFSSHITMKIKPTHERSRARERDPATLTVTGSQPPKLPREEIKGGLTLLNSAYDIPRDGTSSLLANSYQSRGPQVLPRRLYSATSLNRTPFSRQSETRQPLPGRSESPSMRTYRYQSASRSTLDTRGSLPTTNSRANKPLSKPNLHSFSSSRTEDRMHQPTINGHHSSPRDNTKRKTQSSLLQPPMKFNVQKK